MTDRFELKEKIMTRGCRDGRIVCAFAAALSLGATARGEEAPAKDVPPAPVAGRVRAVEGGRFRIGPVSVQVEAGTPDVLFFAGEAAAEEGPKRHWIGLQCAAIPPAVRAQVDLPEGKGLLVEEVVPDSPAAKAGIKPHDVIVSFGEKEIVKLDDLSDAVQAVGAKETPVVVLRGGAKRTIAVTPAEMPGVAHQARDAGEARRWIERFEKRLPGPHEHDVLRFHLVQPGVRVEIGPPPDLPEGYKVTITKDGKSPATIVAEKDGKSWNATEKTIDELPEEVRGWARRAIGNPAPFTAAHPLPQQKWPGAPAVVIPANPAVVRPFPGAPREPLEKRLEETLRRLQELQKSVEEMRKDLPKKPEPPPAAPPTDKTSA